MGRKSIKEEKRRSEAYRIRMTKNEKATLERVSAHLGKSQADIIRFALSWYYAAVLGEEDYYHIVKERKHDGQGT